MCTRILACVALLLLHGCFDPLVGSQCANSLSACGSECNVKGQCDIDGGYHPGALDSAAGEASLDTSLLLDSSAYLDEGSSNTIDVDDSEAHAVLDAGVMGMDGAYDLAADKASAAERQDASLFEANDVRLADVSDVRLVGVNDVRLADASDVALAGNNDVRPTGGSDARPADASDVALAGESDARPDVSDAGNPETKDSAIIMAPDARDAEVDQTAAEVVDASPNAAEARSDEPSARADTAPMDAIAEGEAACPGQQISCDGGCVDDLTDQANCGGCGQVCATGACRFGSCKASTAGQIVVIGHDLQTSNAGMNQVLANAIFLSGSSPVQVAEYVGAADATAAANSHTVISEAASAVGRQVALTQATSADLMSALTQADVFLIQSQATASDSTLIQLGIGWGSELATFVHTGGIIVVLDGSFPTNSGTVRILVEAGLIDVAAINIVNDDLCSVKTATDPVAASVSPSGYRCLPNSISYKGAGIHVIEKQGQPVVLRFTF